jgi:hypothetical protein
MQRYLHFLLNWIDHWDDMRRYDYAYAGFTLPTNFHVDTFIRRIDHPSAEISTNGKTSPMSN